MILKTKIHLACADEKHINNTLKYVHFVGEFLYASNGHVMVKQHHTLHGISKEEMKILDGKIIHHKAFAILLKAKNIKVTSIELFFDNKSVPILSCKAIGGDVINFDCVIPSFTTVLEKGSSPMLGITPARMKIAGEASANQDGELAFDLYKHTMFGEGRNVTINNRRLENAHIDFLERIIIMLAEV